MSTIQLRPRATAALAAVASSLFLLLCLANYGAGGFAEAADPALHLRVAGWFVEIFGAGAFVLVLMPLIWGVVVYFHEETPDLRMRAFGTLLLASSVSLVAGLLQGAEAGLWTGGIGVVGVWLVTALDAFLWAAVAHTVVWTLSLALFVVSLVWATDWMFHTLRRGSVKQKTLGSHDLPTEDTRAELREPEETASTEREFISHTTEASVAAHQIPTFEARPPAGSDPTVPDGFSAREESGRVLLSGPSGYKGVEFIPQNLNLALPDEPEAVVTPEFDEVFEIYDEPLVEMVDVPATTIEIAEETAEEAAQEMHPSPLDDLPEFVAAEVEASAAPDPYVPETDEEPALAAVESEDVAPEDVLAEEAPAEVERPRSGIGFPEDSPFLDEMFTVGVVVDDLPAPPSAMQSASIEVPIEVAVEVTVEIDEEIAVDSAPAWSEARPVATQPDATPFEDDILVDEVFETPVAYAAVEEFLVDDIVIVDVEIPADVPVAIVERAASAPPRALQSASTESESAEALLPPTDGRLPFGGELEVAATTPSEDMDARFDEAVEAVLDRGRASAMVLQRVMGIGHARGLRLLRQMEELGVVGAESGTGTREILVTREEWSATAG